MHVARAAGHLRNRDFTRLQVIRCVIGTPNFVSRSGMTEYVLFALAVVWDIVGARTRHQNNSKGPPLGDL